MRCSNYHPLNGFDDTGFICEKCQQDAKYAQIGRDVMIFIERSRYTGLSSYLQMRLDAVVPYEEPETIKTLREIFNG